MSSEAHGACTPTQLETEPDTQEERYKMLYPAVTAPSKAAVKSE
eukprot:CAMPEP_0180649218 /NCGR_PEP_ID=MMETSP1037_2-20121125/51445_1 /TAXON_ID=632150 /ORGANISM="Azadinium spinosum, Strain 3D9" /LENGTH=43 /DNA_ID= /DNA_START= /DNA_END= /DNA_ORIENTATION=